MVALCLWKAIRASAAGAAGSEGSEGGAGSGEGRGGEGGGEGGGGGSAGLGTEGLFRLTPDPAMVLAAERELLREGTLSGSHAPEVVAHLLKSFFRRLPKPGLLGRVPIATIEKAHDAAGCTALLAALPPLERELLEWLVRRP